MYSEEYNDLNKKKNIKVTSSIAKLNPFVDNDGVIGVGSRLELTPLSYDAKFPPVLPIHHWVSQLLARHIHCDNGHIGQEHTLNLLRERFWICDARPLVRKIINKCFVCRKAHAPQLHQHMAPLPKCQVTAYKPPFTYVGIDLFAPLLIKQGWSMPKRWGCIFTCMVTCAMHLEVTSSLETDDFINTLRQFCTRRGTPKEIRTDCGSNFRGVQQKLGAKKTSNNNYLIEKFIGYFTHQMYHISRECGKD